MSVVQLGAQVSLTPRSGLFVWQAAVQALTSQAVPVNFGSVGEGVGVGVGFTDGVAGPAASADGTMAPERPRTSATRNAGKKREQKHELKRDTNAPQQRMTRPSGNVPEISPFVNNELPDSDPPIQQRAAPYASAFAAIASLERAALPPSRVGLRRTGYFLHCPLALRSCIVCAHQELQPAPGVAPALLVQMVMQALKSQLTASAGDDMAKVPRNSAKRNAGKRRDMNASNKRE